MFQPAAAPVTLSFSMAGKSEGEIGPAPSEGSEEPDSESTSESEPDASESFQTFDSLPTPRFSIRP